MAAAGAESAGRAATVRPRAAGLGLLAVTWLTGLSYGFSYAVPHAVLWLYWLAPTALLTAAGLAALLLRLDRAAPAGPPPLPVELPLLVTLALDLYFTLPLREAASAVIAVVALLLLARRVPARAPDLLLALALAWVAWQALQGDWHGIGGDLLPIVVAAGHALLAGADPYAADYSAVTSNPFFYLPLQWLPYVPAAGLGFDPRLVNLAALAALAAAVRLGLRRRPAALAQAYFVFFPVLLSTVFLRAIARTYIFPYCLALAALAWLLGTRRDRGAALLLGAVLAARQTALALAAALLAGCFRFLGPRRLAGLAALALLVPLATLGPFALWHPHFLRDCFVDLPRIALANNAGNPIATGAVGIVPLLRRLHLAPGFAVQALAAVAASLLIALRRRDDRVALALALGGTDLLVAVGGAQVFEYYVCPGLLMLATGLLLGEADPPPGHGAARS